MTRSPESLISGYMENALGEAELAELEAWIDADLANAAYFMRHVYMAEHLRVRFVSIEFARRDGIYDEDLINFIDGEAVVAQALRQQRLAEAQRESENRRITGDEREDPWSLLAGRDAEVVPTRHIVIPRAAVYAGVSALAAMMLLATYLFLEPALAPPIERGGPRPVAPVAVAKLVDEVDAQWQDASYAMRPGAAVYDMPLTLTHGLVRLRFANEAEVIIEAPATFQPLSSSELKLARGRLVGICETEASRGFTVLAPNARIIDRGTRFAVEVTDAAETLAHVFQGHVDLTGMSNGQTSTATESLSDGQAAHVDRTGTQLRTVAVDPHAFVQAHEFEARVRARDGSRLHQWLAHSYQLRRDPSCILYYSFDGEEAGATRLRNRAASTGTGLDATLGVQGGAEWLPVWVEGRLPGKSALAFGPLAPTGARALVVPHHPTLNLGDAFTLAVWIKPDSMTKPFAILSKRHAPLDRMAFQLGYHVNDHLTGAGHIQFGTGDEKAVANIIENFVYSSETRMALGRWHHLVVTGNGQHLSFYLNGRLISRHAPRSMQPGAECDAPLLIGSDPWPLDPDAPNDISAFSGSVDEVLILRRALSAEEITVIHQAGAPSP